MISRFWYLAATAVFLLGGCKDDTLTRQKAAEIIQKDLMPSPVPITSDVNLFPTDGWLVTNDATGERVGELAQKLSSYIFMSYMDFQNSIPKINQYFQLENYIGQESRAVVRYIENYRSFMDAEKFETIKWTLGKHTTNNQTGWAGVNQNQREVVHALLGVGVLKPERRVECYQYKEGDQICKKLIAERKFGSVTGITGDEKRKTVEYTIKVEPTDLGKTTTKPSVETRSVVFVLYDDGWRMTR